MQMLEQFPRALTPSHSEMSAFLTCGKDGAFDAIYQEGMRVIDPIWNIVDS